MSNMNPEGTGTLPGADGVGNHLSVAVVDANGNKAGSTDLPAELFGVAPNIPLMHQVVVAQLAAARQGTHKVKGRGEVSGSGSKPWRQKGTGRARHGSRRSPQWAGGGVVHGPVPRDYAQRTPKKMIAAALRGALSDRAAENRVHVVSNLLEGQTPSTQQALAALARVTSAAKVLVVLHRDEDVAWLSLRNAVNVHVLSVDQLNAYDVLIADEVVFTGAALDTFVSSVGKARNAKDADAEPTNAELSAPDATEETAEPSNAQIAADAHVEEPK